MATQDYWRWVAAGRPFRRPPWLTELHELADLHGVPFLGDLGSDDERHLQAVIPQDHCPFSWTEWPVQIAEYVINAIDLGRGEWAYRLINAAKGGRAPWVKYVNINGQHFSIKNGWYPVPSNDLHGHVSGRTDHTWTGLAGFNPFIEGGYAMTDPSQFYDPSEDLDDAQQHNTERMLQGIVEMRDIVDLSRVSKERFTAKNELAAALVRIESKLDQLLTDEGTVTARPEMSKPAGLEVSDDAPPAVL